MLASDASTLREKHRIIGTLVGCLPRCPTQNNHLGMPLELMPEEARLLLDKGKPYSYPPRQIITPITRLLINIEHFITFIIFVCYGLFLKLDNAQPQPIANKINVKV